MPTIVLNAKDNLSVTMEKVTAGWTKMQAAGTSASGNISKGFQGMANKAERDAHSMAGTIGSIFAGLGAGLSVGALVGFLKEGIDKAREAEGIFTQLRFAVNVATDDGFNRYGAAVEGATERTARYAVVTQATAQTALQILVTNTGKLTKSIDNLNLVFDLATAKHIDMSSAARIVSLAMEGNVIALRKQLPEFAELLDELDKHADRSEKSALAVKFLHDKLDGATGAMSAHQRSFKELHKAWEEFWKEAGETGLTVWDRIRTAISGTTRAIYEYLPATVLLGQKQLSAAEATDLHAQKLRGLEVAQARAALAGADLAKTEREQAKTEREQAEAERELNAVMDHLNESARLNAELYDFDTASSKRREAASKALTKALSEEEQEMKKLLALQASLKQDAQTAFLTRGGSDDALRRIRQEAFSGSQSVESLQNLLKVTGGLKEQPPTFDEGLNADQRRIQESIRAGTAAGAAPSTFQTDQARLLRDLTEALSPAVSQAIQTTQGTIGRVQQAVVVNIGGTELTGFVDQTIGAVEARRALQRGIE